MSTALLFDQVEKMYFIFFSVINVRSSLYIHNVNEVFYYFCKSFYKCYFHNTYRESYTHSYVIALS